jgi:hypothetical protein
MTTIRPPRLDNRNEDQTASVLRPIVIEQIAHWWKDSLDGAAQTGKVLEPADVGEIAAKFHCSEDEAIRGLSVGEHLYWSGGQ